MTRFNTSGMRSVSAPFPSRGYLAELQDEDEDYYDDDEMPSAPKHPKLRATKSVSSLSALTKDETKSDPDAPKVCSVCSASASPLSILVPCEHLICSSCLTGALNIVGEKDMRCTSCDKPVNDFKLLTPLKFDNPKASSDESKEILEDGKFEEKKNEQSSIEQLLPSVFDETLAPKEEKTESTTSPQTISPSQDISSTPNASSSGSETDVAVLRIDNVPWVWLILRFYLKLTPVCRILPLLLLSNSFLRMHLRVHMFYLIQRARLCHMHSLNFLSMMHGMRFALYRTRQWEKVEGCVVSQLQ